MGSIEHKTCGKGGCGAGTIDGECVCQPRQPVDEAAVAKTAARLGASTAYAVSANDEQMIHGG